MGGLVPLGCTGMLCWEVFCWCKTGQSWCVCVWAAVLPEHNSLVEHAQPWVPLLSWADVALCPAQAWAFSFEELLLCEMQQHLSGLEFQLDTASAPAVWCRCPVSPARAVPAGPCCLGLVGPALSAKALWRVRAWMDGWMEHSAQHCVTKNVTNLLQEDGPTQPISRSVWQ